MSDDLLKQELAEIEEMVEEAKKHDDYTEKVFIIREGMVKLAGGFGQAALLSSLLGWTRHWLKTDNEVYKQIQQAAEKKDLQKVRKLKDQIRQGWFWKATREMSEELLKQASPKTCERWVKKFEDQGLIESREPEEKAIYRAKWYKANINKIKKELNDLGFELDHYKDLKNSTRQNDESQITGIHNQKQPKPASLSIRQNDVSTRQNDEPYGQNDEHLLYTSFTTHSFTNNTKGRYVGSESPNPVFDFYKENFELTGYAKTKKKLTELVEIHGEDLVNEAIKRAVEGEAKKPVAYISSTLRKWLSGGVTTVEDIKAYEEAHRSSQRQKKSTKPKMTDKLPYSVEQQIKQAEEETSAGQAPKPKMTEEEMAEKQAQIKEKLKTMNESLNSWMYQKQNGHS